MKKLRAFLLAACMVFTLTACEIDLGFMQINFGAKEETRVSDREEEDEEPEEETEEETEPEEETAPAEQADLVYVLTSEIHYNDGERFKGLYYSYDSRGNLARVEWDRDAEKIWNDSLGIYEYRMYADGEIDYIYTYEYDDHDNLIKAHHNNLEASYDTSIDFYDYVYEFDGDGNIISCREYYQGEPSYRNYQCEMEWENGRLTEVRMECEDFRNDYEYEYSYSESDSVERAGVNDASFEADMEFVFNADGKLQSITAVSDADSETLEYSYDGDGWLYPLQSGVTFTRDVQGNLIAIEMEYGYRIEYTYEAIEIRSESPWNGSHLALKRQENYTMYDTYHIPGLEHYAYILGCPRW